MCIRYFPIIALLFPITGQADELLKFHHSKALLSDCIRDYLLNGYDPYYRELEKVEVLADLTAQRFYNRSETVKTFNARATQFIGDLKRQNFYLFNNHQVPKLIQWVIREALLYCADGQSNITQTVPNFENEPTELAKVLDYILVDWPLPLHNMIGSKYGRALLRRYAKDAKMAFDRALNYVLNRNYFRVAIRDTWMQRAREYFDSHDMQFPYIQHRYSISRGLYVQGDIQNMSWIRKGQNFSYRNPPILQALVTEFLKIHDADRLPRVENNIFVEYERNGMSSAEYYIETRIDQFYLILLFVRELQIHGISTDGDDVYDGLVSYQILNKKYQQMLYDNAVYQKILLDARKCTGETYEKLTEDAKNEIAQIFTSISVHEESMVMAWLFSLKFDDDFLIHCFDDTSGNTRSRNVINPTIRLPLPIFSNEPHELATVLDYILVDWPSSLQHMISLRDGRAILRRYASDALLTLGCALNSVVGHGNFRYLLRLYWMHRAELFFSGNEKKLPYLRHRYTLEHPFLYTIDDEDELISRRYYRLRDRNPAVSQEDFDKIINIHAADRIGHSQPDVFSVYEQSGTMTRSQHYLEIHIDQFYRILFFFLELKIHGISSDEEDIYNKTLPYDLVPLQIQEIVHNDRAYCNYLSSLRTILENTVVNSEEFEIGIRESLSRDRIYEEDLISLLSLWLLLSLDSDTNTNANTLISTTSTTSITSTMITTPKNGQLKRKGSVRVNSQGKHFCNSPRRTNFEEEIPRTRNEVSDGVYGFVTHGYNGGPSRQTDFPTDELIEIVKSDPLSRSL